MPKAKHRRGEAPAPEIVAQAETAAGVLALIFNVSCDDLLNRPRPSGKLRNVRDLLMGVLHHKLGVSQQKIAAALERDRGTVSDGAKAVEEAAAGDDAIRFALNEITEKISEILTMADAWNEALDQASIDRAIANARAERIAEAEEDDALEHDIAIAEIAAPGPAPIRCHQCYGKRTVRIHRLGGDPAYRAAWDAAEARSPSVGGFHELNCRFCGGTGQRAASPAAVSASAILGAGSS